MDVRLTPHVRLRGDARSREASRNLRSRGACLIATILAVGAGCRIDELALEGKLCPCVSGFSCDPATNRCVTTSASGGSTDAGLDASPANLVVRRFSPTWSTSRSVRWEWDVDGPLDAFAEYQLIVGSTEDAVARQSSETIVFDQRVNPELGNVARSPGPEGGVAKGWTITDRHLPDTKVFARLVARDKAGATSLSAVASAETLAEGPASPLFVDRLELGASLKPAELQVEPNDCYLKSSGCLVYPGVNCGEPTTCRIEMGIVSAGKTAPSLTRDEFDRAFVELAVRRGQTPPSTPFADVVVTIGDASCRVDGLPCRFRLRDAWSFRSVAKEFRLVQLPLRGFALETAAGLGSTMSYELFAANGFRLDGVAVDGEWPTRMIVALDHLHLRW